MTSGIEENIDHVQKWIKENTRRLAFKVLDKHIIQPGICTECGTCVSICPVDALTGVRDDGIYTPTLTGTCSACGMCYTYCPRTYVLSDDLIGPVISAWKAKNVQEDSPRQNGGVATAILSYMLENKKIDAAVMAGQDESLPWLPRTLIETAAMAAIETGGTIYAHNPVVEGIIKAFKEGYQSIAAVGTSCNIDAIKKLESYPAGLIDSVKKHTIFKIGLFCMEAFDYPKLVEFLKEEKIDISSVTKFEISGGKFKAFINDELKEWPVGQLDPAAASSCAYCTDLTSKNADVSVGNIGSDDEFSTVLVRTERAKEIFEEVIKKGIVEAEPLDPKMLNIVNRVARSKAIRIYSLKSNH